MHVYKMQLVITNRLKSKVKQLWSIAAIPYIRNTVSINYMQQEVFVQFFFTVIFVQSSTEIRDDFDQQVFQRISASVKFLIL